MKGRQAIERRERGSGMARETESGKFVVMASESHWYTRSSLGEMTNSVSLEGLFRNANVATSFLIQDKNRISTLTNTRSRLTFVKSVSLFSIARTINRKTSS